MKIKLFTTHSDLQIEKSVNLTKWMALDLAVDFWWMKPIHGKSVHEIPTSVQLLVGQYTNEAGKSRYSIVIPAVNKGIKARIIQSEQGLMLEQLTACVDELVIGVQVYECESILEGIKRATENLAEHIEGFNLRGNKKIPKYYDYLGWCTWDVFYREVSEAGMIDCLEVFKDRQINPYYIILDDGWQDVSEMHLNSIFENDKFPSRLVNLVQTAKEEYGVKEFGIWHALQGYWGGINPNGPLAHSFEFTPNETIKYSPYTQYFTDKGYFINEQEIAKFYEIFYKFLSESGIDLVKVDSQGSLLHLCENELNPSAVMGKYQKALQEAGRKYFNNQVLYCMSHVSDVIFNTYDFIAWRNSDDFFPTKPIESQLEHFYINGMNNIFTSTFAYPDWDMYQTNHPFSDLHSLMRAISGGPLYICDAPRDIDSSKLDKLMIDRHKVLRFNQPALPYEDCLMSNCQTESVLFKVHNESPFGYTVMALNLCENKKRIEEDLTLPSFGAQEVVCFDAVTKKIARVEGVSAVKLSLDYGEATYLTFVPVMDGIAPIGLSDKYNSYLSLLNIERSVGCLEMKSLGEGPFWCYIEAGMKIKGVTVNGKVTEFSLDNQILCFQTEQGDNKIVISF
ncbi:MAG: Sip1-related alpha-galactosidase [Turicibacter sp.]